MPHKCPEAERAWRRGYNNSRRKKIGDKLRLQERLRMGKVQDFIRSYKTASGCADCGYNQHHAPLEFDHVRGSKKINVCNAKSIEQARAEIEKCEVVCSNCHRIRTFNRLQERREK